jgi:hypothetical protein
MEDRPILPIAAISSAINLDLTFAFSDLELARSDLSPLSVAPLPGIRLASIKENVSDLSDALNYALDCRSLAQDLSAIARTSSEPKRLTDEAEEWLAIINASVVEALSACCRQTTACLTSLKPTHGCFTTLIRSWFF